MAAYHQMGNDSWNLVADGNLGPFEGIVLSPVNDALEETRSRLQGLGLQRQLLEVIFDPQLYKPQSDRGQLMQWSHYPKDIDSADVSSRTWWDAIARASVEAAVAAGANAVCSPASLPKAAADDEYYQFLVERADATHTASKAANLSDLMTCIVSTGELAKPDRALHVASILTRSKCRRAYVIFNDAMPPKAQYRDHGNVVGAMSFIGLLEAAGMDVLVACSGMDMALWKRAGASKVATGKFFNLRRFTPGRWEDPSPGGAAVPHWTEFGLFTWLRDLDTRLLRSEGLLDTAAPSSNPYSRAILAMIDGEGENPDKWLSLSWRQYLYEFSRKEAQYHGDPSLVEKELLEADQCWGKINEKELLLYERDNDGGWVRPWSNAVRLWKRASDA